MAVDSRDGREPLERIGPYSKENDMVAAGFSQPQHVTHREAELEVTDSVAGAKTARNANLWVDVFIVAGTAGSEAGESPTTGIEVEPFDRLLQAQANFEDGGSEMRPAVPAWG